MGRYSSPHLAQVAGIYYQIRHNRLISLVTTTALFTQRFYNLSPKIRRAMRIATSNILSVNAYSARVS